MNKLLTTIVGAALGLTMAVGVGVAVANSREAEPVYAASPVTLTTNALSGTSSDGNVSWSSVQGSSGTAPAIYNSGIRLYQNGGFIQLKGNNGVKITGFTAQNTGTYATTANYAVSESAFSTSSTPSNAGTNTSVAKNDTYSISGLNSTYVAIICRGSDKNSRFEISSISVTYSGGSSTSYTITYNANGGTGTVPTSTTGSGNVSLPSSASLTRTGYVLNGWADNSHKADGGDAQYALGGTYNLQADVTLYAHWIQSYTVTYTAGTNGSGSYAHTSQPSGTYSLLPFASLSGVSASTGYKFKDYTVGGVTKNPGDTITLSAATAVTVNFEVKPMETTYDFTKNFSTYATSENGWTNGYLDHTGLSGKTDIGGDYAATIDLYKASKQTGTITTMPVFACKQETGGYTKVVNFALTESGYKIKSVSVTFAQWATKTPSIALFKGNSVSGTPLDTGTIGTKNTVSTSNLNGTEFCIGYCDGSTSNVQSGISSITISLEALASFGTLDHISVTGLPNTIYHVGETYDDSGLAVTAYDGVDEATANFKDVTSSVITDLDDPTPFVDGDVPGFDCDVSYTGDGGSDTTSFHVYVYALAEYELVTSDPTDWSGNYLIVSTNASDELVAMNGSLEVIDNAHNNKVVAASNNVITTGQELEWVFSAVQGGYSIQGKSGKYIGSLTSANGGMLVGDTPRVNTISISGSDVTIAGTNNYHLRFNTGATDDRFRYYEAGTVKLYKLKESSAASDFADSFLDTLSTGSSAVCQYDEGTGVVTTDLDDLKVAWALLADDYASLSHADQEQFRLGVASSDPSATNIAKALALYDHIATVYGTRLQSQDCANYNFMNRSITPLSTNRILNTVDFNGNAPTIVIIVSMIALTTIGGYFFLKKKKEQ